MGDDVQVSLANGFYVSEALPISNQQLVNAWVNIPQTSTLTEANLFGGAGISDLLTTGSVKQVNRGGDTKRAIPYYLNGETLYRVDRSIDSEGDEVFTSVALGTIEGADRASFASNGQQLMVLVPGGSGYIIDEDSGTPFQEITAPGFTANGNPLQVAFHNSYFFCITDEDFIIQSDPNNGLVWDSLRFGSAEADPDATTSIASDRNTLYVGGRSTIELFDTTDTAGFNLQRLEGRTVPKGVFAPFTFLEVNSVMMFVGGGETESPAIWSLQGGQPVKISTTSIDSILQRFTDEEIQSAFAFAYAQRGAYFVAFTFPQITLEFNTVTGLWNERESQRLNPEGTVETTRWRVNSLVAAYGRLLVADYQDGRIGELDPDVYVEYDRPILRRGSLAPLFNNGNSLIVSCVEFMMESGVGNDDQPNPEIRFSYSKDGKTFKKRAPRKIGAIGMFNQRQIWRSIGRFDRMGVLQWEYSDPCKFVLSNVLLKAKGGRQRG